MSVPAPEGFSRALAGIPEGTSTGEACGKRYAATRTVFNAGRSTKLVAEALDRSDYISLNYYDLAAGARLAPCEMPAPKVIAFVEAYRADRAVQS